MRRGRPESTSPYRFDVRARGRELGGSSSATARCVSGGPGRRSRRTAWSRPTRDLPRIVRREKNPAMAYMTGKVQGGVSKLVELQDILP